MATLREDFIQFFEEKKKGIYLCPVCASHLFNINITGEGANEPALLRIAAGSGTHDYHALSCANCGHTTFLHAAPFLEWRAKKGLA